MKRKPRRRRSTISSTTASTVRCRGRWPSVFHTEQNEQCFGQPRTVCTDAHMYLSRGISDQRAGLKSPPSTLPPSYIGSGALPRAVRDHLRPHEIAVALDDGVRAAERGGFLRIERRVDAAEHDVGAARARLLADFVALNRVAGMNADADDVAGRDGIRGPRVRAFRR